MFQHYFNNFYFSVFINKHTLIAGQYRERDMSKIKHQAEAAGTKTRTAGENSDKRIDESGTSKVFLT